MSVGVVPGQVCLAQVAKVGVAPVARHLVASVRLFDGGLTLGTLFGLVPHVHI